MRLDGNDDNVQPGSIKTGLSITRAGSHSKAAKSSIAFSSRHPLVHNVYTSICIFFLFLNYFLAQYDKFILSYFQASVLKSLSLASTQYGLLSGYATGIVYALLAIPIAYTADYTSSRVWLLSLSSLWWSLCVIFQGLSHNFWQILLARIGMGIGQASVESLSVSLISDFVGWRNVFLGESVFYVGVYIGEAVSGQIATAFTRTGTSWQVAMKAIGIVGVVVAVLIRVILREPERRASILETGSMAGHSQALVGTQNAKSSKASHIKAARADFLATLKYILRMRSFWLLLLSASFRQLAGNVFGYYMPSYLSSTFPSHDELLSRYGIIVGVVGTVSVMSGGIFTSLFWHRTKLTPVYITALGGMISSVFVLLMIFSRDIAGGHEAGGLRILYGTMSAAYLTAELWLGSLNALVALLLPSAYKTFGLAVWSATQVLIYSAGPEIIGLALRNTDPGSQKYRRVTQIALAVIIPAGYWLAGMGFLLSVRPLKHDLLRKFVQGPLSLHRRLSVWMFMTVLGALVVALFTVSIVYKA